MFSNCNFKTCLSICKEGSKMTQASTWWVKKMKEIWRKRWILVYKFNLPNVAFMQTNWNYYVIDSDHKNHPENKQKHISSKFNIVPPAISRLLAKCSLSKKQLSNKQLTNKQLANKKLTNKQLTNRANKEAASKQAADKEAASKHGTNKEAANKEASSRT